MARSKTNTIQVNKQIVKFNYPSSCRKRVRPRKKRRIRENICGKIFQLCDDEPKTYFTAVNSLHPAIVRVDNRTKGKMIAKIIMRRRKQIVGTIRQGQQVSFSVPTIRKLLISCSGDNGVCNGAYRISLR
ncbi:S-Ena type endospore appendage [Paenibacillus sp. FSL H8-0034]|uniref:S-Ena type endospore appendage n=1 Tax=Paenibacillus sp. FSL H8-0034 TaxID=2954671 RepID=UPI004046D1F7